jgi:hypothetical protein
VHTQFSPNASSSPIIVVAIPVCNEEECIGACLTALSQQTSRSADHVLLLVNNTTDATIAEARAAPVPPGTQLHIVEQNLPPAQATAGYARRLAMQEAAALAGPNGVLLTTDADGRVDPDWVAVNMAEIAAGADAVAGWVDLDPIDWGNIPMHLHEADARECAYDNLCDEIHARLDPDPYDPAPRHTQNSGASIAVTANAYNLVGGVPPVPYGEDRAFLAALRRYDARIRHSPACHVTVSGRTVGRARGGMADTIRRRLQAPDAFLDDRLEPARDCARRAALRRKARLCFEHLAPQDDLAVALSLDRRIVSRILAQTHFGGAWHDIEARSPVLRRFMVRVDDLAREMECAREILMQLQTTLPLLEEQLGGTSEAQAT